MTNIILLLCFSLLTSFIVVYARDIKLFWHVIILMIAWTALFWATMLTIPKAQAASILETCEMHKYQAENGMFAFHTGDRGTFKKVFGDVPHVYRGSCWDHSTYAVEQGYKPTTRQTT